MVNLLLSPSSVKENINKEDVVNIIQDSNGNVLVDPNWEDVGDRPGNKWKRWDAKTIKNAPKGTKIGDLKLNNKGQRIPRDNRYKPFATVSDYINHLNRQAGAIGINNPESVSYTHLTLPTTPYV